MIHHFVFLFFYALTITCRHQKTASSITLTASGLIVKSNILKKGGLVKLFLIQQGFHSQSSRGQIQIQLDLRLLRHGGCICMFAYTCTVTSFNTCSLQVGMRALQQCKSEVCWSASYFLILCNLGTAKGDQLLLFFCWRQVFGSPSYFAPITLVLTFVPTKPWLSLPLHRYFSSVPCIFFIPLLPLCI